MKPFVMLAIGAHPDDVEIGMGGTIRTHVEKGDIVYICNLTKAELSSNGTPSLRQQEATKSANILGVKERFQLEFPDRNITKSDPSYDELVKLIRTLKPNVVFAPYYEDRHPDHTACSHLVKEAVFDAKIRKYLPETEVHQVEQLFYYFINGISSADFYVDISDAEEVKMEALSCYESQFVEQAGSVKTPLTDRYLESVRHRDALFGKAAGVHFAEGFKREEPMVFSSIPKRSLT